MLYTPRESRVVMQTLQPDGPRADVAFIKFYNKCPLISTPLNRKIFNMRRDAYPRVYGRQGCP